MDTDNTTSPEAPDEDHRFVTGDSEQEPQPVATDDVRERIRGAFGASKNPDLANLASGELGSDGTLDLLGELLTMAREKLGQEITDISLEIGFIVDAAEKAISNDADISMEGAIARSEVNDRDIGRMERAAVSIAISNVLDSDRLSSDLDSMLADKIGNNPELAKAVKDYLLRYYVNMGGQILTRLRTEEAHAA
jgi:hypothetical protein